MGYFDNPQVNTSVICCFTVLIPPTPVVEVQPEKPEKISPLFIVIVCVLGGCFLLVSYFAIIVKYCANLKKSRRPQVRMEDDLESHHDFVDGDHDGVVNHPIWYIHTVGLAQSVVEAIGAFGYKRGEGLVEGTECLVCLSEFEEDQALRLLPKCSHAFHVECIDTWLMSHTNCPCCRAAIVASTGVVAVGTGAVPSLGSSDAEEATREVDVESGGGVETGQNADGGTSDLRVRVEDESKKDDRHKEVGIVKNELEMFESSVLRDLSDSDWVVQNGKQPGRRSVSLDFVPTSEFSYSVDDSIHLEGSEDNLMMQKHGNSSPGLDNATCSSSKGMILSKIPFSMKRSFSTGGKLVSSRLNRTRSAILPL